MAESTECVEVDFSVDRRLINSSDGARLRLTVRRVGFIDEFIENSNTAGRVASALELSVSVTYTDNELAVARCLMDHRRGDTLSGDT